ncbi:MULTISPECIES: PAS domain S-box protein [unclassified Bradyrhizobium]
MEGQPTWAPSLTQRVSYRTALSRQTLGSASDAIIATDADGRITFWNPRIFGFTSEQAVGNPLDLIIPENLRARHGRIHSVTGNRRKPMRATAKSCRCRG